MVSAIVKELKHHLPFTLFGALTGIVIMLFFGRLSQGVAYNIFYVLHPVHVLLSALVTASLYRMYQCGNQPRKCSILILLVVGYVGAVGIAALSDSVIPYLAEGLLDMPNRHMHLGFIEKWWLVNPLAAIGVTIAYFKPTTKFPHAGHVLLSTWASLFHIVMAKGQQVNGWSYLFIFIFLFLAVWIPCCISDIVFPLLLVKDKSKKGYHHA